MKKKLIKLEALDYNIWLLKDCSNKQAESFVAKKTKIKENIDADAYHGLHIYKDSTSIIRIASNDISTIIHEMTHALGRLLDLRMMNYSDERTEIWAYYFGYYISEAIKFYKPKR